MSLLEGSDFETEYTHAATDAYSGIVHCLWPAATQISSSESNPAINGWVRNTLCLTGSRNNARIKEQRRSTRESRNRTPPPKTNKIVSYRGHRASSLPNGRLAVSIVYSTTPQLQASALKPSYPCEIPNYKREVKRATFLTHIFTVTQ